MADVTGMEIAIPPHCQEYVAKGHDEDETVPFQLHGAVTPGVLFECPTLAAAGICHGSQLCRKLVRQSAGAWGGTRLLL